MLNRKDAGREEKLRSIHARMEETVMFNGKGGVGKTTAVTTLASYLAAKGDRVVLFDVDFQRNATQALISTAPTPTLTDILKDVATLDQALVQVRPNLWLVPSDKDLNDAGDAIVGKPLRLRHLIDEWLLRGGILQENGERALPTHLLFDTAGMATVTKAAILASKDILIPFQYEYLSFTGIFTLIEKLTQDLFDLGASIDIRGLVPSMVDSNRRITRDYYRDIRKDPQLGPSLWPPIHRSVRIAEAQARNRTILEHLPQSRVGQELEVMCQFYTGERNLDDYLEQLDREEYAEVEEDYA